MFEMSEVRNSTLYFLYASNEYNGEYYCVVSKNGLSAESERATYIFGGSDSNIFVVEPTFTTATQSTSQTLTCQTSASLNEPPVIEWFYLRDNKTKYSLTDQEYAPYDLSFFNIHTEGYESVLELVYASKDYDGEYYCVAKIDDQRQASSHSAVYIYKSKYSTLKNCILLKFPCKV